VSDRHTRAQADAARRESRAVGPDMIRAAIAAKLAGELGDVRRCRKQLALLMRDAQLISGAIDGAES
jgi:hypothetical protein